MKRLALPALGLACALALLGSCFGPTVFRGEQFAYRDAAHFYYPLYQRVQQEWQEGRIPLWEPEENGGMPLLGNPTAAVLYPGKIIYSLLPYPSAARVYIIFHVLVALITQFALLRSWKISWSGSTLGALAYAFGAPVLFQYCNIIFLVGAAWMPLGLRGADRWLRLGRRNGLIELALVLSLQTLGGDPQAAYVLGLAAGAYALGLARVRQPARESRRRWNLAFILIVAGACWCLLVLLLAHWMPWWNLPRSLREEWPYPAALHQAIAPLWRDELGPWLTYHWDRLLLWLWAAMGVLLFLRWFVQRWAFGRSTKLLPSLAGLLSAALLSIALMGAQILPVLEFTGLSDRAAPEAPHELFSFSVEPYRLVELAWPGPLGNSFGVNHSWLSVLPPRHIPKFWVPSLYLGGLSLCLALGALGWRDGPPWRTWMTGLALVCLVLSLGEYASPLWIARCFRGTQAWIGGHDVATRGMNRPDGGLHDGFGSPYWFLVRLAPGFRSFRYPSKLLAFSTLALSALAGAGWDRVVAGHRRRVLGVSLPLALLGFVALGATYAFEELLREWWAAAPDRVKVSSFGPFNPLGAMLDTRWALAQGGVVLGLSAFVCLLAARRPRLAAGLALAVMTVDLAVANSGLVYSVPQRVLEERPEVLRLIEEAERDNPADGPYRVHRVPIWDPAAWGEETSTDRLGEMVAWERKTIQPKYAIPYGLQYTLTMGTAELYDFWFFFAPWTGNNDDRTGAMLGLPPGTKVIYYPRRGFDLWNSRYFVLPAVPQNVEHRGIAAFLPETEAIYPPALTSNAPDQLEESRRWARSEDWQILRNKKAFPRAWTVHQARVQPPIRGLRRSDRQPVMEDILYQADAFWYVADREVFDPHEMAWVETDDPATIASFVSGGVPTASEQPRITGYEPERVEMEVTLEKPGLVVLADVFYPGWTLTIDDNPAPIYRTNRLMRGAAVGRGKHRLVYTYDPRSFHLGIRLSIVGLFGLVAMVLWARFQPRHEVEGPDPDDENAIDS